MKDERPTSGAGCNLVDVNGEVLLCHYWDHGDEQRQHRTNDAAFGIHCAEQTEESGF